jgi:peptidoglycan/LPS O-acetylase OafA/YrhL
MAALSESEIRKILGNTGPTVERTDVQVREKAQAEKTESLDNKRFTAGAAMLMGIALMASALYTATGTPFLIQSAVAAVMFLAGVIWYVALRREGSRQPRG